MHSQRSWIVKPSRRRGVASLDYVLVLSVVILFISAMMGISARLIGLIYRMISGWVSWPFL